MKKWKILILIPYLLLLIYFLIFTQLLEAGLGGLIVALGFWTWGFMVAIVYTIILGIALVVRWLILRRRKSKSYAET